MTGYEARYPELHRPARWAWGGIEARFRVALPADELVSNVHVIGFVADRIVVCRDYRNVWMLPGGTREAGESVAACVDRELLEEAGARRTGPLTWFGHHDCVSDRSEPYKPWQPHPRRSWLWCYADVELVAEPTNPDDGEQIVEVRVATLDDACELLRADSVGFGGERVIPDVVRIAADLRGRAL
jgi:8-oxo-dGTP diphosphatase